MDRLRVLAGCLTLGFVTFSAKAIEIVDFQVSPEPGTDGLYPQGADITVKVSPEYSLVFSVL